MHIINNDNDNDNIVKVEVQADVKYFVLKEELAST